MVGRQTGFAVEGGNLGGWEAGAEEDIRRQLPSHRKQYPHFYLKTVWKKTSWLAVPPQPFDLAEPQAGSPKGRRKESSRALKERGNSWRGAKGRSLREAS